MCGSELASIDWDASDDSLTRSRIAQARWSYRYLAIVGALLVVGTGVRLYQLMAGGGSLRDWGILVVGGGMAAGFLLIVPALWRAWRALPLERDGRLAACHACGHRWRL
jgi:hypothetical protein